MVTALAFGPGASMLASSDEKGNVCLWDTAHGKKLQQFERHPHGATALACSPDGKVVALGVAGVVQFWDVQAKHEISLAEGHAGCVNALAFLPNRKAFLSVGRDRVVRVWDLTRERQITQFDGYYADPTSVALSPDGNLMACMHRHGQLAVWQLNPIKMLRQVNVTSDLCSLAFVRQGKVLAGSSIDGTVDFWNVESGRHLPGPDAPRNNRCFCLASSSNGRLLATAHVSGSVYIWAADEVTEIQHLRSQFENVPALGLRFSPDGKLLASGLANQRAYLWEVLTGQPIIQVWHEPADDHNSQGPFAIDLAPDGFLIATAGMDGGIRLWSTLSGELMGSLKGHRAGVSTLLFAPESTILASGGDDGDILLWDVAEFHNKAKVTALKSSIVALDVLWSDLTSDDARKAYQAGLRLGALPQQTIPFLRQRLRPVEPVSVQRLTRLAADLNDKDFVVRENATKELQNLEEMAAPALLPLLTKTSPPEQLTRARLLINKIQDLERSPSPRTRQARRAVTVLEHIANADAIEVLRSLAAGHESACLTKDAIQSLRRLTTRR
jgi:WD40 repeat protein